MPRNNNTSISSDASGASSRGRPCHIRAARKHVVTRSEMFITDRLHLTQAIIERRRLLSWQALSRKHLQLRCFRTGPPIHMEIASPFHVASLAVRKVRFVRHVHPISGPASLSVYCIADQLNRSYGVFKFPCLCFTAPVLLTHAAV